MLPFGPPTGAIMSGVRYEGVHGKERPSLSVIIPAYNEEASLGELKARLQGVAAGMGGYDFEFIVIENGSLDLSCERLTLIHAEDPRFKVLQLSRNFGCEGAISAGLRYARGDAAIILFADLQEPPEMIPGFVAKWEEGYDIVYGVLKNRNDISLPRKVLYTLFYKAINALTRDTIKQNATDFRLLDRRVYSLVNRLEERNKFMRGVTAWIGFKQAGIPYERAPRFAGVSKADYLSVITLAVSAIINFSSVPLLISAFVGFAMALASFLLLLLELVLFLIYGRALPGIATLTLLMLFSFGMAFSFLGVQGIYIGKIYEEIKARPDYIVKGSMGFHGDDRLAVPVVPAIEGRS